MVLTHTTAGRNPTKEPGFRGTQKIHVTETREDKVLKLNSKKGNEPKSEERLFEITIRRLLEMF